MELQKRANRIKDLLDSKKAQHIVIYDLQDKEYITQCVVIATALAGKHSYALLDFLREELKPLGEVFYSTDEESEDWIIADLGEIMVHIFTDNTRKRFNLEEFLENYFHAKTI
ncbi:ribosome silencing factor [Helicobacter sp. T3_23-1056]